MAWSDIAGATSDTYTIPNVPPSDNGFEFRGVFTSGSSSATTNPATLTVISAPPTITTQPSSQSVFVGTNASFSATASGTPSPTVQWQESTDGASTWNDLPGATSLALIVSKAPLSDNGDEFRAVFTNASGSTATNAAVLTVIFPPPPTTNVGIPADGATISGSSFLDAAASSAVGVASVSFEVSGGSVTDQVVSSSGDTAYGWIGGWDTTDVPNGTYSLQSVATDSLGQSTTSAPISVTVNNPPLNTEVLVPSSGATLNGQKAVLDASASGPGHITSVQFVLSGGSLSNVVVATAGPTLVGYLALWDTTGMANGTYTLQSVATESEGPTVTSAGITVTVAN
jgi:hypothetical protein